jgi:hypothetical protein
MTRTKPNPTPTPEAIDTARVYVKRLRNADKREYADRTLIHLLEGGGAPAETGVTPEAAQAVREHLAGILAGAPRVTRPSVRAAANQVATELERLAAEAGAEADKVLGGRRPGALTAAARLRLENLTATEVAYRNALEILRTNVDAAGWQRDA